MSLPGILAEEEVIKTCTQYLKRTNTGAKKRGIGIVWAAAPQDEYEAERRRITRSLPCEAVKKLLKYWPENTDQLIALQLGIELQWASKNSKIMIPKSPTDWEDTAHLVEGMEAIITVDTAMAHLAGALGIPTILLLNRPCDWRWGQMSDTREPLYTNMKILRCEQFNRWDSILHQLPEEVRKLNLS